MFPGSPWQRLVQTAVALFSIAANVGTETPAGGEHWAFRRPVRPDVSRLGTFADCRTPIDAFIIAKLEEHRLSLSPDADRVRLFRRAYFDLIGLPPRPDQIDAFLQDNRRDAYERVIDQLLASPQFGVRWGRHWLDIAGYTDTISFDDDFGPPIGFTQGKWRYRDYVVHSFNDDKPYDQFLTEQLAGDEMVDWRGAAKYTPEIIEHLVATGFLRCCEDISQEDPRPFIIWSVLHDTVTQLGTSVLGLSLTCARCHDHKFEPISQEDYYRVMALFTPALNPGDWRNPQQRALPDVSAADHAEIQEHNARIDKQVAEANEQIADVRRPHEIKLREEKLAGVSASVRDGLRVALGVPDDKRDGAQKELVSKYEKDIQVSEEAIAAALSPTDQESIKNLNQEIARLNGERRSHGWIMGMADVGPPPATQLFKRGDYLTPGQEVPPGFVSALSDDYAQSLLDISAGGATSSRRTALAHWLTDCKSPAAALVARVMVNRVWQYLLGEGIVTTPENLGVSGAAPTHPELLDWLAVEFIDQGWRIKPLIKRIMMSSVYRQASFRRDDSAPNSIDPANRLLWRARLRRAGAEVVRDTMLALSDKLDTTLGGPPVPLAYHPDGSVTVAKEGLPNPSIQWRRSLYLLNRRIYNLTFLSVFDKPIVTGSVCQRDHAAVPLQSLAMLNDALVIEQARYFAQHVQQLAPESLDKQIVLVYRLAFGRQPLPEEQAWSRELVDAQAEIYRTIDSPPEDVANAAMASLCQTVMSANEFLYLE